MKENDKMKKTIRYSAFLGLLASLPVAGCMDIDDSSAELNTIASELYVLGNSVWATGRIPVCWENPTNANAQGRTWTQQAVRDTWEANSDVRFTGWGACTSGSQGVRILVSDQGPHVKSLGSNLDGMTNGMVLNFTFANWGSSCQSSLQYCIEAIGVHEFGHALGFAHEQNRPDTPSWCDQEQGTDGDITVGAWDLDSVMNYCNPDWNGDGDLSATDIAGVQQFYGNPASAADIVWQHSSGQVHYWPMQNGQRTGGLHIHTPVGSSWSLRGVGDVNGDNNDDIIWQHSSGQVHYWPMQNGQRMGGVNIHTPVGSSWSLRGVGDVNGDGTDDIVWQHSSGQVHYWPMQNGQRTGGINIHTPVGSSWSLRGVGDVNGDGTDDIVWQHSSGQVHYWPMQNGQRTGGINIHTPVGSSWSLRGVGDVDYDGTDDIVWQHSSGQVHYWPMQNGQRTGGINIYTPVGSSWTLRGVGNVG